MSSMHLFCNLQPVDHYDSSCDSYELATMTVDTNSSLTGCAAEYALGGNYYIGIAVVYILTILILFIGESNLAYIL